MTSDKQRQKQLVATAHHEAGHAIVAFFLLKELRRTRRIRHVTIEPDGDLLGHVKKWSLFRSSEGETDWTPLLREKFRMEAMISLAGSEAEKLLNGRANHVGAASDYHHAADMASRRAGDDASLWLKYTGREARAMVKTHWSFIQRFAEELLTRKTIHGAETDRVVVDIIQRSINELYPSGKQ